MADYEERHMISQRAGWALLILFALAVIGWGTLIRSIIPERPREWDYGALEDTPSASVYSTREPGLEATPSRQMEPLPEAISPEDRSASGARDEEERSP